MSTKYLGERHDEVVKLGLLGGRDDLIHADFPRVVTILDVFGDAAVEQHGLLGDDADLGAKVGDVDASRVVAIDQLREGKKWI